MIGNLLVPFLTAIVAVDPDRGYRILLLRTGLFSVSGSLEIGEACGWTDMSDRGSCRLKLISVSHARWLPFCLADVKLHVFLSRLHRLQFLPLRVHLT